MVEDPRTLTSFWNNLAPHKRRNILSSYVDYTVKQGKRGPAVKELPNPLFGAELDRDLEDVIYGVCNLDWSDSGGLKESFLYAVVSQLPVISRITVQNHLVISERHARRYVEAANLVIKFASKKPGHNIINNKEYEEIGMEDFESPYEN